MQVHASREIAEAIVVDEEAIKRLWHHIESYTTPVSAEVKCSDDITRTFVEIKNLLDYENNPNADIKQIELTGRSLKLERSITIILGRNRLLPTSISIRGEEAEVSEIQKRICDTLYGMKAWYSKIAGLEMLYIWCFVAFLGMSILTLMAPSEAQKTAARSFPEVLIPLFQIILLLTIIVATIWATNHLKNRFFPLVHFSLGQGKKRFNFDEQIRWSVIIALAVGMLGSALWALLVYYIQ